MFPQSNPNPSSQSAQRTRCLFEFMLAVLVVISVVALSGPNAAHAAVAAPSVTGKLLDGSTHLISVQGEGFTQGGRIQIAVTDLWGNPLHQPVWTVAAPGAPFGDYGRYSGGTGYGDPGSIHLVIDLGDTVIYGPNGSQDPANGYDAGAGIATIEHARAFQVRAFDKSANSWSNVEVVVVDDSLGFTPGFQGPFHAPHRCVAFFPCVPRF